MTPHFKADPAFDPGSIVVCDWPLCQVRLQDDTRFPWLILIPRREGLHEIADLDPAEARRPDGGDRPRRGCSSHAR